MSHGMENWHPNPDFFFLPGGGPMLDLGPYYIANLINLIGPVRRVARPHLIRQPDPHHHLAAAQRRGDPGQDAHQHPCAAGVPQRRDGQPVDLAGMSGPTSA